jgi:hypothetical protein
MTIPDDNSGMDLPDEPFFGAGGQAGAVLKSRKTVELTEEFATEFLEIAEFVGDRALLDKEVIRLARLMEAGLFRSEIVQLVVCIWQGRKYRMNGQHTAWARLSAKVSKATRWPVQLFVYEAKTEQEMRELYSAMDRNRVRTPAQVTQSYLFGTQEFEGFSRGLLRGLSEGLALWKWPEESVRRLHSVDERSFLMLNEHHKLSKLVGGFLRGVSGKTGKHLWRAATVGAMYATFDKAPQISAEFWQTVHDGIGITAKGDPRLTLRNYLTNTRVQTTTKVPGIKSISAEEMYRGCIRAWNTFRDGGTVQEIRVDMTKPRPGVK